MRIDQIHDARRAIPRINLEFPEGNRGLIKAIGDEQATRT
jgi:hypothetical protein